MVYTKEQRQRIYDNMMVVLRRCNENVALNNNIWHYSERLPNKACHTIAWAAQLCGKPVATKPKKLRIICLKQAAAMTRRDDTFQGDCSVPLKLPFHGGSVRHEIPELFLAEGLVFLFRRAAAICDHKIAETRTSIELDPLGWFWPLPQVPGLDADSQLWSQADFQRRCLQWAVARRKLPDQGLEKNRDKIHTPTRMYEIFSLYITRRERANALGTDRARRQSRRHPTEGAARGGRRHTASGRNQRGADRADNTRRQREADAARRRAEAEAARAAREAAAAAAAAEARRRAAERAARERAAAAARKAEEEAARIQNAWKQLQDMLEHTRRLGPCVDKCVFEAQQYLVLARDVDTDVTTALNAAKMARAYSKMAQGYANKCDYLMRLAAKAFRIVFIRGHGQEQCRAKFDEIRQMAAVIKRKVKWTAVYARRATTAARDKEVARDQQQAEEEAAAEAEAAAAEAEATRVADKEEAERRMHPPFPPHVVGATAESLQKWGLIPEDSKM